MLNTRNHLKLVLGTGLLAACQTALWASPLEDTVNTLQEWVNTERMISEAASEWEADKASMENLIAIYKEEVATLDKTIEDAERDTSAAEVLRNELQEQREASKKVEAEVVKALIEAEIKIKTLEPVIPPPLQEELSQLFNTIPENPKDSKLAIGQRIQPIAAILTQVQKFNQVVTLIDDFREFEEGRMVQTETVYFGLGGAFYVDQANENAGIGIPGENGWVWTADNSLVSAIRSFVDIYRGKQQARYVNLPVNVK